LGEKKLRSGPRRSTGGPNKFREQYVRVRETRGHRGPLISLITCENDLSSRGMFVGELAMFVSGGCVLLRIFMLAEIVMMGRLMVMMRGGVVVSGRLVVRLTGRMLR
jgi:hypothetical protein